MKSLIPFVVIILILGCYNTTVPKEIVENGLKKQFEVAKWEIYALYLKCTDVNETREILSHDIMYSGLDTIDSKNIIIHFGSPFLEKFALSSNCFYYNGIGFDGKAIYSLSRDDGVVLEYQGIKSRSQLEEIMLKVDKNKDILTPWLKNYIKRLK